MSSRRLMIYSACGAVLFIVYIISNLMGGAPTRDPGVHWAMLGMILVIQTFVYPNAWTEHLMWSSMLVFLASRGPGMFSLDHVIARRYGQHAGTTDSYGSSTVITPIAQG